MIKNFDKMLFVWGSPDGGTFAEFQSIPNDYTDISQAHWIAPDIQGQYEVICEAGGNSVNMEEKSVIISVIE